eukprot:COSAG03_NODE_26494_length_259_cov_0.443750_1_plen_53_part_01
MSHVLSTTTDYLPTIASLAGAPLLTDRTYDGLDLSPGEPFCLSLCLSLSLSLS